MGPICLILLYLVVIGLFIYVLINMDKEISLKRTPYKSKEERRSS